MGFNEQQRGDSEGYRGTVTGPPKSLDEALGRGAGQARREQELLQSAGASTDDSSAPSRLALYAVGLLTVFALARWLFRANLGPTLLLVLALGALLLSSRLGGLLGPFKALYMGLWAGAAFGAFSLVMQGAPLSLSNIAIHLILGGAMGLVVAVLRLRQRR